MYRIKDHNFGGYLQTLDIALHPLVTTHERLLFSFHGKRENIFTHSLHGILIKESKESATKCRQAVYRCAKRTTNNIILKISISITTIFEWVMDSINCLWLYMYFEFDTTFFRKCIYCNLVTIDIFLFNLKFFCINIGFFTTETQPC